MNARLLLLFLAAVGLIAGLFLILDPSSQTVGERDEAPTSLAPSGTAPSGKAGLRAQEETDLSLAATGTEADRATRRAEDPARLSATSGGRELVVSLRFPEGTPSDPGLSVLAVSATELEGDEPYEFLDQLRQQDEDEKDRSALIVIGVVEADGRANLVLPATLRDPVLLVDGRFLYQEDPLPVPEGAEMITLEPRLGAHLTILLSSPKDVTPEGEVSLAGGGFGGRSRRGWQQRKARTDASNELVFRGLEPDLIWTVQPSFEELYGARHMGLEFEPGQDTSFALALTRGATITGKVSDASGSPLAEIEVKTIDDWAWLGGSGVRRATTDSEGRFELQAVGPGEQQLSATADGWKEAKSDELELSEGERRDGLSLVLERGASISGVVLWPEPRPAAGARVVVEGQGGGGWGGWGGSRTRTMGEARCDEQGRFAISGLDEGAYTVRATQSEDSADGADSAETEGGKQVVWRAAEQGVAAGAKNLTLTLTGPLPFSGRVVDDLGQPVTAFEIELRPSEGRGPREEQKYEDEEGRFLFARVGPGEWQVTAQAEGHEQLEPTQLLLPGEGAELELRLERTASVAGRVVDALSRPVSGALVRADAQRGGGNPWGGGRGPRTETDAKGEFVLDGLTPGSLALVAEAEGWADSLPMAYELAPGDARTEALLELRVGGRIEGAVLTPEGEPLASRRVTYGANSMGWGSDGEATTDSGGRFHFDHVTPGDWSVSATPSFAEMGERMNGRRGQSAWVEIMGELVTETVSVVDGEISEVFLGGEPRQPVRVVGTVSMAGEPLADAEVFAVSEGSAVFQGMKTSRTNPDGSYEIVVDRPGSHVISTRQGNLGVEAVVDIPRSDETRVDLAIPLGRIEGRVKKPDGRPASRIRLNIQREDGLGRMRWNGDQARTDELGNYSFEALQAGRYTVRANVSSWGGRFDDKWGTAVRDGLRVEPDAGVLDVDFRLEEAGSVEGLVKGPDGEPMSGASVFFRDSAGLLVITVSATTSDANGRFRRTGLAPGEYAISARAEGFAASDATNVRVASNEASEAELEIEAATMLLVTLEEDSGDLRRAKVEVLDGEGREVGGLVTVQQLRAAFNEGTSSLEQRLGPLPPGRYTVRATTPDGRTEEKRVTLRGRQGEKKIRLKLDI